MRLLADVMHFTMVILYACGEEIGCGSDFDKWKDVRRLEPQA